MKLLKETWEKVAQSQNRQKKLYRISKVGTRNAKISGDFNPNFFLFENSFKEMKQ